MSKRRNALIALVGIISALVVGVKVGAQSQVTLFSLRSPVRIAVNSSFISPLDELFGDDDCYFIRAIRKSSTKEQVQGANLIKSSTLRSIVAQITSKGRSLGS